MLQLFGDFYNTIGCKELIWTIQPILVLGLVKTFVLMDEENFNIKSSPFFFVI